MVWLKQSLHHLKTRTVYSPFSKILSCIYKSGPVLSHLPLQIDYHSDLSDDGLSNTFQQNKLVDFRCPTQSSADTV